MGADFDDFTGDVAARNMRQWDGHVGEAATHPKIEVIQGAGADSDEGVSGTDGGFGCVGIFEDLGAAVL